MVKMHQLNRVQKCTFTCVFNAIVMRLYFKIYPKDQTNLLEYINVRTLYARNENAFRNVSERRKRSPEYINVRALAILM